MWERSTSSRVLRWPRVRQTSKSILHQCRTRRCSRWGRLTAPTINADWTQVTAERWLVPFGGGAGRTFNIGTQAVDSNVTLYYNAIRPASQLSAKWQLSLQFTLLYPKGHRLTPASDRSGARISTSPR